MDADERAGATIAAFPALLHVMEPSARLECGPTPLATDSANGSVLRGGAEGEAHAGAVPTGGDGAGAKPGGAAGAPGREPRGVTAHRIDVVEEWAGLAGGGGGFAGARPPVKPACQMFPFPCRWALLLSLGTLEAPTSADVPDVLACRVHAPACLAVLFGAWQVCAASVLRPPAQQR